MFKEATFWETRWWENYLSKRSLIKYTCWWCDKLIISWFYWIIKLCYRPYTEGKNKSSSPLNIKRPGSNRSLLVMPRNSKNVTVDTLWCHSAVLSILHKFTQQILNSASVQIQMLLSGCQRSAVVRTSDNSSGCK